MTKQSYDIWKKHTAQFIIFLTILLVVFSSGCSVTRPKLTAEDRKRDIQYLADWTRDYNPFVELNQKYKNTPSYEELLPKYLEFAEKAETDEEFFQVAKGYSMVIGASGHFGGFGEEDLKLLKLGSTLGLINFGVTPGQFDRG